tara:strand:+ start:5371 stop:6132 length:762 start_codon:yes stop_codon:yes gene_type:complete
MKPLRELDKTSLEKVKILLFDLDGTFVDNDSLQSSTYSCLERVVQNGIKAVVVTGRPAGWCDLIARWWPVDSVIGENGAFSYSLINGKMQREIFDKSINLRESNKFLKSLLKDIKVEFGEVHLAADQEFRQWDLAIDISEEYSMPMSKVQRIHNFCISKGANAAISNIHLNIWYGNYSKREMSNKLLNSWNIDYDECIYIGDSPNDEPMFKEYPLSVGVKSIEKYVDIMANLPSYITKKDANQGFEELVDFIL